MKLHNTQQQQTPSASAKQTESAMSTRPFAASKQVDETVTEQLPEQKEAQSLKRVQLGAQAGSSGAIAPQNPTPPPPVQFKLHSQSSQLQPETKVANEVTDNQTGLPDSLKTGLERLSGFNLSDVSVNYNSPKPAKINALAYTQGQNIEVGPGQEQHLPHEGWHIVQQMQGRVKPSIQAKGLAINDDTSLEREADVMGTKALRINHQALSGTNQRSINHTPRLQQTSFPVIQRALDAAPGAIEHVFNSCYLASILTLIVASPGYRQLFNPQNTPIPQEAGIAKRIQEMVHILVNKVIANAAPDGGPAVVVSEVEALLILLDEANILPDARLAEDSNASSTKASGKSKGQEKRSAPKVLVKNPQSEKAASRARIEAQQDVAEVLANLLDMITEASDKADDFHVSTIDEKKYLEPKPAGDPAPVAQSRSVFKITTQVGESFADTLIREFSRSTMWTREDGGRLNDGAFVQRRRLTHLPKTLTIEVFGAQVDAPNMLTIPRQLTGADEDGPTYKLEALVRHRGDAGGGHYVAYAKGNNTLYESDDLGGGKNTSKNKKKVPTKPSVKSVQAPPAANEQELKRLYVYTLSGPAVVPQVQPLAIEPQDRINPPAPAAAPPSNTNNTTTLLAVAKRLVDDLESHRRGWLIDLKPRKLFAERKKIETQLTVLLKEQGKLTKILDIGQTRATYDKAVREMQRYRQFVGGKSTEQYQAAAKKKKEIEAALGVKGRKKKKKVTKQLLGARDQLPELQIQLAETRLQIVRLEQLSIEIVDRAVARGAQIEELAKARGDNNVKFPWKGTLESQMGWLETWMEQYPEPQESAPRTMIAATAGELDTAKKVLKTEAQYQFGADVYQTLLSENEALTRPGTSMSQSIKFTFTVGEVLEGGFFVQVSGEVATGDDRKIRPKLAFKVGGTIKIDLGIWDVSASISLTYAMAQGFDGLHHFAAHYMRILSLYNVSFRNYWALRSRIGQIKEDDPQYRQKRNEVIREAAARGLVDPGTTVEVGTEQQAELAAMQARPPVEIRAVNLTGDAGIAPNDNATGALAHFGGVTLSLSYTRKRFTKLVDYEQFVAENDDTDEEIQRLKEIRRDYIDTIDKLDDVRRNIRTAVLGAVPPMLRTQEAELEKLKNMYEEGHLTFTRRGRSRFLAELDERIAELEKQAKTETTPETVEDNAVVDVRGVEKKKKKKLTKTGSVVDIAVGGSASIGGLAVSLGGKLSFITNDANPDNDGRYLNLSLTGGTDITAEALDPESSAGQSALESIAESGTFQEASTAPTSSAAVFQLITNLEGAAQAVSGILAGGVKLEVNMVWSNGWWRTQYVRVTRSRQLDVSVKAKTGQGINLGVGYSGGRTDFVAERIGTTTFTYLLTVYQGMRKHKDFASEWATWKQKHHQQLWLICQQVGLAMTTSRAEVEDLPNGKGTANDVSAITSPLFAQQSMQSDYQGGPLPFDKQPFEQIMRILEAAMEREAQSRASLARADLTEAAWSSAEGGVNSEITIPIKLGGPTVQGPIEVASKAALTRRVKGSRETVDNLTRYGNLAGLLDAGARLRLSILTGGQPDHVVVTIADGAKLDQSIDSAAKALVKAVGGADLSTYSEWQGSHIVRRSQTVALSKKPDLVSAAKFDLANVLNLKIPT